MVLKKFIVATMLATMATAQDGAYQAYSPGQYNPGGAIRSTPRLVPVKSGQPVKRIRLAGAQQNFALEQPVEYTQTVPAVATYRPQGPPLHQAFQQQQQPAYYVQRAPQPQQLAVRPVGKAGKQTLDVEEEYPSDPNPQYNFAFDVKDDELTNYQNRQEERDGGVIKGSYSVVDPDGYVRTVTYTADSKNGFQAKVTREPTDVKVKFPVPTPAPDRDGVKLSAGPGRIQYQQPQYQQNVYTQPQQPQYDQGAYSVAARRFPQARPQ